MCHPPPSGGLGEEENLWIACSLCNDTKLDRVAGRDPVTGDLVRLFNPRRDIWSKHFAWSDDGTMIVGRTAEGRATVALLKLNRSSLVIARRGWVGAGWHPPTETESQQPSP
ncbi:HNH endonuclease [bacterium]|nr:MAG: HNH endonuclease [bacterium]